MADEKMQARLAHMVFFTLTDASAAARAKLTAACHEYLSGHEGVLYFSVGTPAAGLEREVNVRDFDVALHVVFENRAAHDRYQVHPRKGEPNMAPAMQFLRKIMAKPGLKLGTICHSLWLLCADRTLLEGRHVTCAHNIICDVENAGGEVIFDGDQTVDLMIDGDLITGKHPGITDLFLAAYLAEIEKNHV